MFDEYKTELTKKEENYRKKIQSEIVSCYNCQPYDSGEPVWIYGEKTEIEELFYKFNVEDKYWENISGHLTCSCGTELELGCDVGVKSKYDKDLAAFINSNKKLVSKINLFIKFLSTTPLLAYKHNIGKSIFNQLKTNQFPITSINLNDKFFRARRVNGNDIIESHQMLSAPIGKSSEGRFNHSGQSYLYLASSEETAIREVTYKLKDSLVWIQEFEVSCDVSNILDLTFDITNIGLNVNPLLLSLCMANALDENKNNVGFWRPDYFLTRYIMDCAKELNYNGIKYNSTRYYSEFNIVIFNPEKYKTINIGNPKVKIFKSLDHQVFNDFSDLP